MSDKTSRRGTKYSKISIPRILIALVLTGMTLAVFPVLKHYISSDMTWFGGMSRLVQYMISGVYFGVSPAVAALLVVIDRFKSRKTTMLPATIAAAVTWVVQYVLVLVVTHVGPAWGDALYGLVSAFCAAAFALLVGRSKKLVRAV